MIKIILILLLIAPAVLPQPDSDSEHEDNLDPESERNPKLAPGEKERVRAEIREIIAEGNTHGVEIFQNILDLSYVSRSKCGENWHLPWAGNRFVASRIPGLEHFMRASLGRQLTLCIKLLDQSVRSHVRALPRENVRKVIDLYNRSFALGYDSDNDNPSSIPDYITAKNALVRYLRDEKTRGTSGPRNITLEEVEEKVVTHLIDPCRQLCDSLQEELYQTSKVYIEVSSEIFDLDPPFPPALSFWISAVDWCSSVMFGFEESRGGQN